MLLFLREGVNMKEEYEAWRCKLAKGYCTGCGKSGLEVFDTDNPKVKQCRKCFGPYKARLAWGEQQAAFRKKIKDSLKN